VFSSLQFAPKVLFHFLLVILVVLRVLAAQPLILLLTPVVKKIAETKWRKDAKELISKAPESVGESMREYPGKGSLLVGGQTVVDEPPHFHTQVAKVDPHARSTADSF